MSLATQYFWDAQKDALQRIRDDLSASRSKSRSPAGQKQHLPPKYSADLNPCAQPRRGTPPSLPRLTTPPSHDKHHEYKNLRGKKFSKVPPVVSKLRFSELTSDDSWGEDSDEESENIISKNTPAPQPIAYPMPYLMSQPALLYPPPSIAVYYPTLPHSGPMTSTKRKKKMIKLQSALKKSSPRYDPFDEDQNPMLREYKYITPDQQKNVTFQSPLFEAYSPSMRGDYSPRKSVDFITDLHPFDFFLSHAAFADEFVDDFLHDCMVGELIPDLLMEVLDAWMTSASSKINHISLEMSAEGIYDLYLGDIIRELVRETARELAVRYVNDAHNSTIQEDPLDEFLDEVTECAIAMATQTVVKETVQEMAGEIIEATAAGAFVLSLIDEVLLDTKDELIEDAIWEVTAEAAISDLVVLPEVTELTVDIATETLKYYDSKMYRKELKEVKKLANDKVADSFLLDHLLLLIAQQGHVWTQDELEDKLLDGAMLTVLLEQMFHVATRRSQTLNNSAMHKLHQRVTANVALDLFLERLLASLDEDMADIDEYERSLIFLPSDRPSVPSVVNNAEKDNITAAYSVPSNFSSVGSF